MEKLIKLKNILILGLVFATVFALTNSVLADELEELVTGLHCGWYPIGPGGILVWFCF